MTITPFMVDFSYWNSAHNLASMQILKKWGMSGAVVRAGYSKIQDSLLSTLVGYFRELEVPYGLYWYLYPGVPAKEQVDAFLITIRNYPDAASCFFLDLEEYKSQSGITFSKTTLETFYKECYDRLVAALPGKHVGIYTANWCVSTFFPGVTTWIPKTNGWYADYIKYYGWWQTYLASLGGSWADNTKPISISNLPAILTEIKKRQPHLPQGITNWGVWQCVTFIPFIELTWGQRNLDYNILTPAAWKYWFNVTIPVEPPPPPPIVPPSTSASYKVTVSILRVRSGPGTNYSIVGAVYLGDILKISEIKPGSGMMWGKIGVGWCSMNFLQEVEAPPPPPVPPVGSFNKGT